MIKTAARNGTTKNVKSARRGDCSIIALDKFIQATRDSGYKGMRCDAINRTLMFDMEAVKQIVVSRFPPIEARSAARRIGIPHKLYAELRRHGEIPCNHLTPYERCVAIEDIDAFAKSIAGQAQHVASVRHLYSLSQYLGASLPTSEKIALIRDIRDGRKVVYFRGSQKVKNLWLSENSLAIARESRRSRRSMFTMRDAALRFDLRYYELRALLKHTLGPTRIKQSLDSADVRKLEQFLARYALLRTVSQAEGIDSKALMNAIKRESVGNALLRISAGCGTARRGVIYVTFVARPDIAKLILIARRIRRIGPRATAYGDALG